MVYTFSASFALVRVDLVLVGKCETCTLRDFNIESLQLEYARQTFYHDVISATAVYIVARLVARLLYTVNSRKCNTRVIKCLARCHY